VRHISGVIDRLFTYARGESLSVNQLAALRAEGDPLAVQPLGQFVDEPDVVVAIDQRRHHRLARQIDAGRAWWRLTLTLPPDPGECVTLDEECGILDRRTAVANDEASVFEPERTASGALCARGQHGRECEDERARQDPETIQKCHPSFTTNSSV